MSHAVVNSPSSIRHAIIGRISDVWEWIRTPGTPSAQSNPEHEARIPPPGAYFAERVDRPTTISEKSLDESDEQAKMRARPANVQARFDHLRNLDEEQKEKLNKLVLRKLDWGVLPCVAVMMMASHLVRGNVANARLAGMQDDLGVTDTMWNTGMMTFYIGMLLGKLPGNLWMAKGRPSRLLPMYIAAFGLCTICMSAVTNGAGYALCRFALGLTIGPFLPGVLLLTSCWYTTHERPLRCALWRFGSLASHLLGGVLSSAILSNMDNVAGLNSWQWLMIIEGGGCVILAGFSMWILPDWPHTTTRSFTPAQLDMAQFRMLVSNGGIDEEFGGTWDGLGAAFRDPFTFLFAAFDLALTTAMSFTNYIPSILKTFGWTNNKIFLMQMPPWTIGYVAMLIIAQSSRSRRDFTFHVLVPLILVLAGVSLMIGLANVIARYIGIIFVITGLWSGFNLLTNWEMTVVPAPRSKKASLIAIVDASSQFANWYGPHAFSRDQEPFYRTGGGLMIAGLAAALLLVGLIRRRAILLNRKAKNAESAEKRSQSWTFAY